MGIRRMTARGNDDDRAVTIGPKLNYKDGGEIKFKPQKCFGDGEEQLSSE